MTATDQAFIRIFDSDGECAQAAPHVSFAARGVQLNEILEPSDMSGTGSTAAPAGEFGLPGHSPPATAFGRRAEAAAAPTTHAEEHAKAADSGSPAKYLPSAYRNLADNNGTHRGRQPQPSPSSRHAGATGPTRRRPLAELVANHAPSHDFRPALEVDAIRWPRVVTQMVRRCGDELDTLANALEAAVRRGDRAVLFRSTERSAGCTTLVLASARLLADRGRSVAVVDAEFLLPHLAEAVGLSLDAGWETSLLSGTPLAESVVRSLKDGVSIVPLVEPLRQQQIIDAILIDQVASAWRVLREHFDVVLIDAGCPAGSRDLAMALQNLFSATADACVVVSSAGAASAGDLVASGVDFRLPVLGVVENGAEGSEP